MYTLFVRPLLFLLQPEKVHHIVIVILKAFSKIPGFKYIIKRIYTYNHPLLETNLFGFHFSNPVGLAAGFDKNAEFYKEISAFGFSHIEIGTVTPEAQPGNPKPRSFRLIKDEALINRMGFNNKGVTKACENLRIRDGKLIIGGNIGKNTSTPNEYAVNDYIRCFTELYPYVDYFVVNISCPNIANLKELQDKEHLSSIIKALIEIRSKQEKRKPILLKVSPDLNEQQLIDTIDLAQELKIDGFVATNTTTSREGLETNESLIQKIGNGGLSGKPITSRSTEVIRFIAQRTKGQMPIIGVGGIMSPQDAIEKIEAGASLVQIYTGFIYEGPALAKRICKAIIKQKLSKL